MLNELGRKLSDEFGSGAWVKAHADEVRDEVAGMSPYDVQQFCFDYVTEDRLSEEELGRAKDVAFANGMEIYHVLRVTAFELRDELLSPQRIENL